MRPLAAITLIILGSCVAISTSLAAIVVVIVVLGDEYPRLQHEFGAVLESLAIFTVMTASSVLSFYAILKNHGAQYWAQAVMWSALLLTGWYYWP